MPGHSTAALAAYPEFSCTGGPFEVASTWGIKKDVFCPGNPSTVPFLKDILKEVADLFPYEYIHTGGDEVPKDRWAQCTKCREKIKNENLLDEKGLQIHFTNEIVEFWIHSVKRQLYGTKLQINVLIIEPRSIKRIV